MWFPYALFTVFAWGGSDLFSKIGSDPHDKNSHWKLVIAVGAVMGLHAVWQVTVGGVSFSPMRIVEYLPVSFLYILSMTLGYAGLRYIELSLSSPVCNSSGAITALLCFLVLHQTMTGLQFFAVACICCGLVLLAALEKRLESRGVSRPSDPRYTRSPLALLLPFLYCIIDGLGSFADAIVLEHYMEEVQANLAYEFTFLIAACLALGYLTLVKRERFSIPKEKSKFAAALCETAGQFTYVFAMAANAIVAAPMIASYSIFSVLLSRVFLREKLTRRHYALIVLVMSGIAILGME